MFYRMTWFIVTIFLIVPVIGVIFVWLRKSWSKAVRVALTILFCFYAICIVIFLLPSGGSAPDDQPDQPQGEQTEQDTEQKQPEHEREKTDEEKDEQHERDSAQKHGDPKKHIKKELENMSAAHLLNIKGSLDQEPYDIELVLRGAQGSTESESVKNMKTGILNAVYVVKNAGFDVNNADINVKYPVKNKNGLDEEQFAIKSSFSGHTIDDLPKNRSDADLDKIHTIADRWWKHPVLDK